MPQSHPSPPAPGTTSTPVSAGLAHPDSSAPAEQVGVESRIHAAGYACVLAVTGGGASALSRLLAVPGGSRSILEALIPYSAVALDEFLGAAPEQYCSPRTARTMAMVAFQRARRWATRAGGEVATERLVGLGATASLASDRPKRGPHRAHIAVQTAAATTTCELSLSHIGRTRSDEELLVGEVIVQMLAETVGCGPAPALPLTGPDEQLRIGRTTALPGWRSLLLGQCPFTTLSGGAPTVRPSLVFPGAFHPLHAGHRAMARLAAQRSGAPVVYEIAIENVDKPPLDYTELAQRATQFTPHEEVWLTRAPTFVEKARLFPGAVFVVGADTIVRIAAARYYGGSEESCRAALQEIAELGCRFLVFGRQVSGDFQTLDQLELPEILRQRCTAIDERDFRIDLSSTQLRQQAAATAPSSLDDQGADRRLRECDEPTPLPRDHNLPEH
ncbi:MAG: hypothetical protein U0935_16180 [Pirellulales bacterium]